MARSVTYATAPLIPSHSILLHNTVLCTVRVLYCKTGRGVSKILETPGTVHVLYCKLHCTCTCASTLDFLLGVRADKGQFNDMYCIVNCTRLY
jgi:hypothetical protein